MRLDPRTTTVTRTLSLILLAAFLAAGCAANRYKDRPVPPMEETEAMLAFMNEDLHMSEEQLNKARLIVMESAEIKQNITDAYRGRPNDLRQAQDARLDKFEHKMEAILTAEQRKAARGMFRAIQRHELDGLDRTYNQQNQMRQPGDPSFDTRGGGY